MGAPMGYSTCTDPVPADTHDDTLGCISDQEVVGLDVAMDHAARMKRINHPKELDGIHHNQLLAHGLAVLRISVNGILEVAH